MGKITGFKEFKRETPEKRQVDERLVDYKEVYRVFSKEKLEKQASRCMNCGIPFCNWACPLGNLIPDFNHMIYKGQWEKAYNRLALTNPFPEFTGRVCPGLCEGSCTLGSNNDSVTIEQVEVEIIEKAFENGWVKPNLPRVKTGKRIAIIGSGPSGLAAASKLNNYGHKVTVFEKEDAIGGLLRYGIPDFKLEKWVVDRRVSIMKEEGVIFKTSCEVGNDYSVIKLKSKFDAIVLTGGCTVPRDLVVEGRDLIGVHYALDFLKQQNKKNAGIDIEGNEINAKDKVVVVIGGGDTGSDCIGTARRHGAKEVYQYEILPKPPVKRDDSMPWPEFPRTLKVTSSHEEGCIRDWCVSTKALIGKEGKMSSLRGVHVAWTKDEKGKFTMNEVKDSEFEIEADLVLIAMGFTSPRYEGMLKKLGVNLDTRGNVQTSEDYMTSVGGIFAAGDMRTGQSLVARAMDDGLILAERVDKYLMDEIS
ncbi:glutamate synthase subunit beta [Clostridium sp.]